MSETELAWAAGFFDGEGSTCVSTIHPKRGRPEGYRHLHLKVGQLRREPLDRFRAAIGEGHVTGPHKNGNGRSKVYTWNAGGNGPGLRALERLWPYLSKPKREQAEKALARLEEE